MTCPCVFCSKFGRLLGARETREGDFAAAIDRADQKISPFWIIKAGKTWGVGLRLALKRTHVERLAGTPPPGGRVDLRKFLKTGSWISEDTTFFSFPVSNQVQTEIEDFISYISEIESLLLFWPRAARGRSLVIQKKYERQRISLAEFADCSVFKRYVRIHASRCWLLLWCLVLISPW